jgi:hypothetical protein
MTVGVYILYGMLISYDISLYHVLACCYIRLNLGFFLWGLGLFSAGIGVFLLGRLGFIWMGALDVDRYIILVSFVYDAVYSTFLICNVQCLRVSKISIFFKRMKMNRKIFKFIFQSMLLRTWFASKVLL